MSDSTGKNSAFKIARKILFRIAGAFVCLVLLCFLALKIYLATPFAAPRLSRLLTSYLHQTVTVSSLHTTGATLYLQGLSLANPSGFPAGNLATADSIAIAPQWGKLLLGRPGFRLIVLEGVRLDMRKDSTGSWNYTGLQRQFAGKKPSKRETFIRQFIIKDGSFQVNGQGMKGISLQVFNLATKGSDDSRIELGFEDLARNHYVISGKARPGKEPAFDLALSAPELSLTALAKTLPLKNAAILDGGRANLQVQAGLQEGQLRVTGTLGFNQIFLPIAKKAVPLTGILIVKADYNLHQDQARIEILKLNVNHLLKLNLTGTARNLRHERSFSASIGMDDINLAALAFALPEKERRRLVLGGTLGSTALHLSGNAAQGITGANGSIMFQDGSLTWDGRLLVSGLNSTVRLSRQGDGFLVKGRLALGDRHGQPLLEAINAPFIVNLTQRLKLLTAQSPALSAKVIRIPVTGRLGFEASTANPFSASLRVPATRISTLQPLLDKFDLHFTSGTGSVALEAVGRGPQDFTATTSVQLAALQGQRGKTAFTVKHGTANSRISWSKRRLTAVGVVQTSGLAIAGKAGEARFSYKFADGMAQLDNAAFRLDGTSARIARLAARIPVQESRQGTVRYPLFLEMSGVEIHQGQVVLSGLSGSLRGSYVSGQGGRWLEGTAEAAAGRVSWQGKVVASPTARIALSPSCARVNLGGALLGGTLQGDISFNPFALEEGGPFTVAVKKVQLARAAAFVPQQKSITLTDGLLDGNWSGRYSRKGGLTGVFEARGDAITLNNNANKTLLAGAGVRATGELTGDRLAIREAAFTAGEGVALTVKGELSKAFSPQRRGVFSFALPQTPFNSIIDPFINILPRFIQEATVAGSLAAKGTLELHDNKKLLNGALAFKDGRLELPSQKFTAADINGSLPFSLDFSGATPLPTGEASAFSRENYPRLLKQLRERSLSGPAVRVGQVSFGQLELGTMTLHVQARNGITEITSLKTSFSEGSLLGQGFVAVKNGLNYRGDLLIHDLSLMQLCNRIPAIKGYISGRLDGVISLDGREKDLQGLVGFTNLWAREGSGEKMLVSKEFLQRMSAKKLRELFFRKDRPYDRAEIKAILDKGDLTFETLDISHTNFFGIRDLSVSVAQSQNMIALDQLFSTIRQAIVRGKAATGEGGPSEAPRAPEFKWQE